MEKPSHPNRYEHTSLTGIHFIDQVFTTEIECRAECDRLLADETAKYEQERIRMSHDEWMRDGLYFLKSFEPVKVDAYPYYPD